MAMCNFHAIVSNVLSETKSINVIFLPFFQCAIYRYVTRGSWGWPAFVQNGELSSCRPH